MNTCAAAEEELKPSVHQLMAQLRAFGALRRSTPFERNFLWTRVIDSFTKTQIDQQGNNGIFLAYREASTRQSASQVIVTCRNISDRSTLLEPVEEDMWVEESSR